MRSRWAMAVCALLALAGSIHCANGPGAAAGAPDHQVVFDLATFDPQDAHCGQQLESVLTIWTDDVAGRMFVRRVSFQVKNAAEGDRVEIAKKADSANDAGWPDIHLDKAHAQEATRRIPQGQVKKPQYRWRYGVAFNLGNGQTCSFDAEICVRTQAGGCQG